MNLQKKNLSEIKPYWRNARKNEQAVEAVIDSIKEYGYNVPIVVDSRGVIITGHTRYTALKRMEETEAYVIVSDMSEAQAKEYRIIDNKTSELAKWDNELLIPELREFRNLEKFTLHFPELKLPTIDRGANQIAENPKRYEVTEDTFAQAEAKLQKQFEEASQRFANSSKLITCPYCDEAFEAVYQG